MSGGLSSQPRAPAQWVVCLVAAALVAMPGSGARAATEIVPLVPHADFVSAVAYAPTGEYIASGGHDGRVKLWDPATGLLLRTLETNFGDVKALAISPDGRNVLVAAKDMTLWDAATGNIIRTFPGLDGAFTSLNSVAYSPDGQRVAWGATKSMFENDQPYGVGEFKLFDVATGEALMTLGGEYHQFNSIEFLPGGGQIAAAGLNLVEIWDLAKGAVVAQLDTNTVRQTKPADRILGYVSSVAISGMEPSSRPGPRTASS